MLKAYLPVTALCALIFSSQTAFAGGHAASAPAEIARTMSVHYRAFVDPTGAGGVSTELSAVFGGCGPQCDECWIGTAFENDCFLDWEDDGVCDCGCQFPDRFDCGPDPCGPECDFCWIDTPFENACDPGWAIDGECDCGCQFEDTIDCGYLCSDPLCDFCWIDTPAENACDPKWAGDGFCDCGCQFSDSIDCGGGGGVPDLLIDSSSVSPVQVETDGYGRDLYVFAVNAGTAAADAAFSVGWFISLDADVDVSDALWALGSVDCCMPDGFGAEFTGAVPWPDVAPVNTPGRTYYVAVKVDTASAVLEAEEGNNWGEVFAVTVCDHAGDAGGNGVVDLEDHRRVVNCMTGPGVSDAPGCLCSDLDGDDDVDLGDIAAFAVRLEQR